MPIKGLTGKTALAYAAGIMDGEGCISLATGKRSTHKRGYTIYLKVDVTNTNEWLLQWLKMQFGGHIWTVEYNPKWKVAWHWEIAHKKAADFLTLILPYLQLKRPQAELAIKFQQAKRRGGLGLTEKEAAVQEAQRIVMSKFNQKGRRINK